jgi:hypothetical protein
MVRREGWLSPAKTAKMAAGAAGSRAMEHGMFEIGQDYDIRMIIDGGEACHRRRVEAYSHPLLKLSDPAAMAEGASGLGYEIINVISPHFISAILSGRPGRVIAAAAPIIEAKAEPETVWRPVKDESGAIVALVYDFVFVDEYGTTVGHWQETDETEPAPIEKLLEEAWRLARQVTKAHPSENPWSGWTMTITATGLKDGVAEIARHAVTELLG